MRAENVGDRTRVLHCHQSSFEMIFVPQPEPPTDVSSLSGTGRSPPRSDGAMGSGSHGCSTLALAHSAVLNFGSFVRFSGSQSAMVGYSTVRFSGTASSRLRMSASV